MKVGLWLNGVFSTILVATFAAFLSAIWNHSTDGIIACLIFGFFMLLGWGITYVEATK